MIVVLTSKSCKSLSFLSEDSFTVASRLDKMLPFIALPYSFQVCLLIYLFSFGHFWEQLFFFSLYQRKGTLKNYDAQWQWLWDSCIWYMYMLTTIPYLKKDNIAYEIIHFTLTRGLESSFTWTQLLNKNYQNQKIPVNI